MTGGTPERARIAGAQLTGRLAWDKPLTSAARKYTREPSKENLAALADARRSSASEAVRLQQELGFEYVTDGGSALLDLFSPYVESVDGVTAGGNINKYPGTRNSYYHTPRVEGRIAPRDRDPTRFHFPSVFPSGVRKKAILPSPVAFALACENTFYTSLDDLAADFSLVLRHDIEALQGLGYEYIQLTECFLPGNLPPQVSEALTRTLSRCVEYAFDGYRGRSALYLHSWDASAVVRSLGRTSLTDLGFDFHTPLGTLKDPPAPKNFLFGLQNTTRKLPPEFLASEGEILASRAEGALATLPGVGLSICPSQDYDGVQTYPQALARMQNLSGALARTRSAS